MSHAAYGAATDAHETHERSGHSRWRAALAGFAAIAVTLGISEFVAAVLPGARSLVIAVGDEIIDRVPGWLERAAIARLGTADKPFLIANILVVSGLLGAALGLLAVRRFVLGALGVAVMAAVGTAASFADPQTDGAAPLGVGIVSAVAGLATLWLLVRAVPSTAAEQAAPARGQTSGGQVDRGRFLRLAGGAVVVAGLGALGGRLLLGNEHIAKIRQAIRIPRPFRQAPQPPPGASLAIPGLSPLFVPNGDFYRIDTALTVPQIDPEGWSLEVRGRVDSPFSLTYAELMAMPQIEADVTLACVSNPIGGELLLGNARWQGVSLYRLLEQAGVHNDATQIVGRSVDGFTAGFPTIKAIEDDTAMVALAMNGEPLPTKHGFPARLVVPGLYGYVSATKWLSSIDLFRLDEFNGYWIPRGWAKEGPIKTQSRIDVPTRSSIDAGPQTIAGVAWAPTRGIERVEVRIDDGLWQQATLAAALDDDTWRQWFLRWDAPAGKHTISVRATDGLGVTQTPKRTRVDPDGASGHHTIEVRAE